MVECSPGEEVHESDLICNCNGPLCDTELVHLLGNGYKGICRAKRGRCFKVFDEHHSYRMSVGCVDLKEIYPIPIFCLPHPKYHMSCCDYSFCDEEITMEVSILPLQRLFVCLWLGIIYLC
ncbi:hypothetical protein COOONC_05425 [Cooperia oncophora]